MNQLLELLFANPFLLIIIVGAIFSFLKRGREQEAQRETRRPSAPKAHPVSDESSRNEVDWREIFMQEEAQQPPTRKVQPVQSYSYNESPSVSEEVQRRNELLEKYEIAKRNKEAQKQKELSIKDSPVYSGDLTANKNKINLDFSNLTKEDAIKGVIWSEILGKPRAKGSYRPSLNTRRKQG
ncbi:hypothetical protein DS745_14310 [Anaerobacillus alkaliphilus]|uniref:Uncharacterized protein n=1 Tax=Anaerobacillus alkaliphilus TaxID=1548597 RepID=A0A4Q0VS69_9BACI|nr:hypothetical protein [Anaerobacillus alkaliphilus]RXI99401.1 hypothetical protein DS745_14310 [Anaerobacillus alkaliphilus]